MEFMDSLLDKFFSLGNRKAEAIPSKPEAVSSPLTTPAPVEVEKIEEDTSPKLKYYPSNTHIVKNQAPESILTELDLTSLAKAHKLAVSKKVLTPDLGAKLLPIAMVEGWSGNYGIGDTLGFHPNKKNLKKFEDLGLTIEDRRNSTNSEKTKADLQIMMLPNTDKRTAAKTPFVPAITMGAAKGADTMARLAAGVLSVKADHKDALTVEDAVELYNGRGTNMTVVNGKSVPADSKKYRAKVIEASDLFHHPMNKNLKDAYYKLLDKE